MGELNYSYFFVFNEKCRFPWKVQMSSEVHQVAYFFCSDSFSSQKFFNIIKQGNVESIEIALMSKTNL